MNKFVLMLAVDLVQIFPANVLMVNTAENLTFSINDVEENSHGNHHSLNVTAWEYFRSLTENEEIDRLIKRIFERKLQQETFCSQLLAQFQCSETHLRKVLAGYMYPMMLALCLVGNSLNFAVYSFDFMKKTLSIKILAARAATNALFVSLLMFNAIEALDLWNPEEYPEWEKIYWHLWPYVVTFTNIFGFSSMWITVLMTLERYLYVICPVRSQFWCTNKNLYISLASIFCFSAILQSIYPATRYIDVLECIEGYSVYLFKTKFKTLEQIYHLANLLLGVTIPMTLMIFMSMVITWKLTYQRVTGSSHISAQKLCISRITLSTTAAHLILELPQTVILVAETLGIGKMGPFFCTWRIVSNFLGTCNASILFFIYLAFSDHFRGLVIIRLKCQQANMGRNHVIRTQEVTRSLKLTNLKVKRQQEEWRNGVVAVADQVADNSVIMKMDITPSSAGATELTPLMLSLSSKGTTKSGNTIETTLSN